MAAKYYAGIAASLTILVITMPREKYMAGIQ
jgi:hypothetical protein